MTTNKTISIRGAREHNLKNLDIEMPRDKLVVITGLSGSGKSSLAFDTIYAEGQRRYVESLSAYARQVLEMMQKPRLSLLEEDDRVQYWSKSGNCWISARFAEFNADMKTAPRSSLISLRKVLRLGIVEQRDTPLTFNL